MNPNYFSKDSDTTTYVCVLFWHIRKQNQTCFFRVNKCVSEEGGGGNRRGRGRGLGGGGGGKNETYLLN